MYLSKMLRATLSSAPQPHSVPKVMVPRQSGLTRSPERPSVLYSFSGMLRSRQSRLQGRIYIAHQVANVVAAVEDIHHLVPDLPALAPGIVRRILLQQSVPFSPVRLQFRQKRFVFGFEGGLMV